MADDWIDDLKKRDTTESEDERRREEIRLRNDRTIQAEAPEFWNALVERVKADCAKLLSRYPHRPDRQAHVAQERAGLFVLEGKALPIRVVSLNLNLNSRSIRVTKSTRDQFGGHVPMAKEQIEIGIDPSDSLVFETQGVEFRTTEDLAKYLFDFVLDLSK